MIKAWRWAPRSAGQIGISAGSGPAQEEVLISRGAATVGRRAASSQLAGPPSSVPVSEEQLAKLKNPRLAGGRAKRFPEWLSGSVGRESARPVERLAWQSALILNIS